MRLLIVAFVYFVNVSTAIPENANLLRLSAGFLYAMPKTLISGKNESVCLSTHFSTPSKLIVDLRLKEKHFFTTTSLDSAHKCFDILVPTVKEPQFVNVRVQVQLNGNVYTAHNQDPVVVYPNKKVIFIETDRGLYRAKDTVKFRVLILDDNLLPPKNEKISVVRVRNPLDISVAVWENISTDSGLVQLEHELSQNAIPGQWCIEVDGEIKHFEVNQYVLPRFNVEIIHPKTIYYKSSRLPLRICSKYSYGAIVKGTAFVIITDSRNNMKPIQLMKQLDKGCAEVSVTNSEIALDHFDTTYRMMDPRINLLVTATVTEYGTDAIHISKVKIPIESKAYTMKFAQRNLLSPGIPYQGLLELSKIHSDLNEEVIEICYNIAIKRSWNYLNNEQCANFTVGEQRSIPFHIMPLKNNVIHVNLNARSLNYSNVGDSLLVVRLFSPSSSYVKFEEIDSLKATRCRSQQQLPFFFTTDRMKDGENVTFYYMIKARGHINNLRKIIHTVRKTNFNPFDSLRNPLGSKHRHHKTAASSDKVELKFKLDPSIHYNCDLLVYYVGGDHEVIAASKEIQVEPCLNNWVKAEWAEKRMTPGSTASLMIRTKSESLCSIGSIDKSTEFIGSNERLNINSFLNPFLAKVEIPEGASGRKSCLPPIKKTKEASSLTQDDSMVWDLKRRKRFVYSFSEDFDAYDILNKFGTAIITNFKIITKHCYTGPMMGQNSPVQSLTDQYEFQKEEDIPNIRYLFPETWLWELVPVRSSSVIQRSLPHSITNWVTNIVCVSPTDGVAFSETTEIRSFQPFFVDALTPYSIKVGEILYLHVIVFNYLSHNLPIKITLEESEGFKFKDPLNRRTTSYCVQANNSRSHIFELKGKKAGIQNITIYADVDSAFPGQCGPETVVNKRDIIFKSLLIEPEGNPIKLTRSALLCGSSVNNHTSWNIDVPDSIVPGTARTEITINGDILGKTIQNLDDIIEMPTGCGEQIMASLAPNLYILRYLNATRTLTHSIKQRIIRNLKIGYQRILNYAHKDGSFSAFGYHDPTGSMFLTAFVVKTLQETKQYIYVDQRIIDKAVSWILEHQLENGCFSTMYHLFQDMGGTNTENSTAGLTSYVIISLLDSNIQLPEAVKTNAKYCIRGHYHLDKYTMAISSYALLKVEWYTEGIRMLRKLLHLSNQKDGMVWWTTRDFNGSDTTDIEVTSYVLLSLLHQKSEENLAVAHSIVRWLTSKQGSKGSFRSTQDTVVALDALTRYSIFLASQALNLNVSIEAIGEKHIHAMKHNEKLQSKNFVLLEPENNVHIKTEGTGCILAQSVLSYYVKRMPNGDAFKLDMEINPVSTIDECSIATLSSCFTYNGPDNLANMAILEVDLPSGYQADRSSLYKLIDAEGNQKVKMFEELEQKVILYLAKLDREQACVNFNINEDVVVESRAATTVKLYDYYKPEYNVSQFYKINDKCKMKNFTLPQIAMNMYNETVKKVSERDIKNGLNPHFVNTDVDLDVPNGLESNMETYMKPNSSIKINYSHRFVDNRKDKTIN